MSEPSKWAIEQVLQLHIPITSDLSFSERVEVRVDIARHLDRIRRETIEECASIADTRERAAGTAIRKLLEDK